MSLNTILATTPLVSTNYILKATGTTIGNSLIWDNGTNVGIGNTNTSYTLDVSGTGRFTSTLLLGGALTGTSATFSGNVGIGKASSSFALDTLLTDASTNTILGVAQIGRASSGTAANGIGGNLQFTAQDTAGTQRTAAYITWKLAAASSASPQGYLSIGSRNASEALTILDSGNVGIGTSTPSDKLQVLGSIRWGSATNNIVSSTDGSGVYMELAGTSTATRALRIQGINDAGNKYSAIKLKAGSEIISFETADVERMVISSGGQVGINTIDGGVQLAVKSTTTTSASYPFFCFNSANTGVFFVRSDGYVNTGSTTNSPYNLAATGRSAILDSGGGLGYLVSTRESKSNIESIKNVDFINQLNPVQFNYRKKDNINNIFTDELYDNITYGFIADEVEKVNKELAFYNADGTLAGVEYNSMIAILTKAVQELQSQINELKNK